MPTEQVPSDSRDRISDESIELENAQYLMTLLDDMLALYNEMNHWPVAESGSVLFEDDQVTHPFPLSNDVRYLLLVAADNLIGLRNMLIENMGNDGSTLTIYPFAPYTLLRNAIECAGTALWLMQPHERHQRVLRIAQFELEDAKKNKAALESMGGRGDETFHRKKAIIERMVASQSELSWKDVAKGFRVTDLLASVGALPQLEGLNPLGKWQIASGMAHGKRWAGTLLSDLKEVTKPSPNGDSTFHIYGNFRNVLWLAGCARSLVVEASNQVIVKSRKQELPSP
jgi:hypothetical protein